MDEKTLDLPMGMLLMAPAIAAVSYVNQRVRASGHEDLTDALCRAVRYTGLKGRRMIDMAQSAHMSKQNMSSLVKELVNLGYVVLADDPEDGRAKVVQLTEKGREAWDMSQSAMREFEDRFRGEMGSRKWERLRELGGELFELVMADANLAATPGWAMEGWSER